MEVQNDSSNRGVQIHYLVWVRAISAALILLCHLTQTHRNPYVVVSSQFFNVGVNIFIVLSGYLFGRLGVKHPYQNWLVKRGKRIFTPYWIFLGILGIVYLTFHVHTEANNWVFSLIGMQRFSYVLPYAEHTWFITPILLCYLITPPLDILVCKLLEKPSKCGLWILTACMLVIPAILGNLPDSAIWANCCFYALAFILGKVWVDRTVKPWYIITAIAAVLAAFIFRFGCKFILDETILYNNIIARYTHFLASFCFLFLSSWLLNRKPWKCVQFFSEISFEVYLCHYLFMQSPLSVMALTGSWLVNALIAVILSVVSALILHSMVNQIQHVRRQ